MLSFLSLPLLILSLFSRLFVIFRLVGLIKGMFNRPCSQSADVFLNYTFINPAIDGNNSSDNVSLLVGYRLGLPVAIAKTDAVKTKSA